MKLPGHPEILGLGTGALGAHHVCEGLSSVQMKTPKMALKPGEAAETLLWAS